MSSYVGSTLVPFTFVAKDMRLLRTIAIFSNLAFTTYGPIKWLPFPAPGAAPAEHRQGS